ncbi:hypothetical protein NEFER03_0624 [Nematocida sp. LUAm3]|nr:hypothetical protein NEFER03_0624 [Nematocida sp. LUAm3]KAI5175591.1 hypothetical protein NEFER02_1497 [Nematocida sp. LUAm2]KAI5178379.1 hypothetical protein NEFER01_1526 [Nematocida sp. LUAm1]
MQEEREEKRLSPEKKEDSAPSYKERCQIVLDIFHIVKELNVSSALFHSAIYNTGFFISSIDELGSLFAEIIHNEIHNKEKALARRKHVKRRKTIWVLKRIFEYLCPSKMSTESMFPYKSLVFWESTIRYLITHGQSIISAYSKKMKDLEEIRHTHAKGPCERSSEVFLHNRYDQQMQRLFSEEKDIQACRKKQEEERLQEKKDLFLSPEGFFDFGHSLEHSSNDWNIQYEMCMSNYYMHLNKENSENGAQYSEVFQGVLDPKVNLSYFHHFLYKE